MTCYFKIDEEPAPTFIKKLSYRRKKADVSIKKLTKDEDFVYAHIPTYDGEGEGALRRRIIPAAAEAARLGARKALASDERFTLLLNDLGFYVKLDAGAYMRRHAEKIIRFAAKRANIIDGRSSLMLHDASGRHLAFELAKTLCGLCRDVYVASENTQAAEAFCAGFYEKTGIPLIVGEGVPFNCLLFVTFGGLTDEMREKIPRRALALDLSGERPPRGLNRTAYAFVPECECEGVGIKGEDLMRLFAMEDVGEVEVKRLLYV
ncbi:MAG: hypothetical protein IKD89_07220 [Clostridia bacterium]|nr:hypothetical protein [Clostridia bacterium]